MEHCSILNNYYRNTLCFSLIYFHDFSQTCPDSRQPTFFVYWFLDGLGPLRRHKNLLDLFGFIFRYLPSLFDLFSFFFFFNFYCNICNVTNPTIDVYEINKGRHHQCQSNVLTHMGIIRRY